MYSLLMGKLHGNAMEIQLALPIHAATWKAGEDPRGSEDIHTQQVPTCLGLEWSHRHCPGGFMKDQSLLFLEKFFRALRKKKAQKLDSSLDKNEKLANMKYFPAGLTSILFVVTNLGVLNSTVFKSPTLSTVTSLALANSGIRRIEPGAFHAFHGLTKLSLYQNSLTYVTASWLSRPGQLENLTVAQNLITKIGPQTFSGFSNLTTLNVASNKIYEIASRSFRSLSKLTLLDLSGNNLTSLTRNVFDGMRKLPVMKLGDNPWNCFCEQQDFVLFLQELINMSLLQDATSVLCHSPPSMKGIQVWNISNFNCTPDSLSTTLGNGFYQSRLPALLPCLVFISFILLVVGMWMVRYANKRVQPSQEVMEPSTTTESKTQVDPAEHQLPAKESENKEIATPLGNRLLKIRAKSASAILLRKEFYQRQQKSMDANQKQPTMPLQSQNEKMHVGNEDLHHSVGLWDYQKLEQSSEVESQSHIKANTVLMEVCRDMCGTKVSSEASEQIMQDNRDPTHLEKESIEHPEPFLYISVTMAPEEQTEVNPPKDVPSKNESLALKRSLTWPFERKVWDQRSDGLNVRESFTAQFLLPSRHSGKVLEAEKPDFDQEWLHLSPRKEHPLCFDGQQEYKLEAELANEMGPPRYKQFNAETIAKATEVGEMELDKQIQRQYDLHASQTKRSQAYNNREKLDLEGKPAELPEFVLQKEVAQTVAPGYIRTTIPCTEVAELFTGVKNQPFSKPVFSQSSTDQKAHLFPSSSSPHEDDGVLRTNSKSNYINLLHEVVENRGRWTRERWKQTHQSCAFLQPPTKSK